MAVKNVYAYKVNTPTLINNASSSYREEYVNNRFERFLREINNKTLSEKAKKFDGKLVWLEEVSDTEDSNFLTGTFKAGRYGEEQDIYDVEQLIHSGTKKKNDSVISEIVFVLCKRSGLFLLESDSHRIVTRTNIDKYLGKMQGIMEDFIADHNSLNPSSLIVDSMYYTIHTILTDDFFEKLNDLARIKEAKVFVDVESNEQNAAESHYRNMANEMGVDGYDQVAISLVNSKRGTGIRHIKKLFENLIQLEKYDRFQIEGYTHHSRHRTVHIGTQAKFFEVRYSKNPNGLPNRPQLISNMVKIAREDNPL
ncbi:hypothetical protein [Pontibacillus salipaludis]|uniref:Uncharacterized protein n=1 Tax=Pontibacillus salipaludis TaxID=1697394 RepID=A0ABQ1PWE7_9BACI|nr:hypothetical protein [Pontibacillus salipaludis]GGD05111.1 hypothetical protein GCM10011389_10740 [Pontibacillus salipaludis]